MLKKRMVLMILFFMVSLSFAQEGRKGIRIKETKGNAGKRWAICIGINDYEDNTILDLKKARNDARELGKILEEYGQFDYIYVMTDDLDAKKENYPKLRNIKKKLKYLEGFIDPEDLVLFSFSGHGIANSKGEGYLVTADSYREDLQGSSLKVKEIIEWLKEVKVKKSLLLLDACREQFQEGKAMNLNGLKAERFLQAEVGAVFYSTKSGWFSYEDKEGNFGIFTRYVIDGLIGNADSDKIAGNEDSIVTFSELASYVEEKVSNWALDKGKKQKPYTRIFGEKYGDLALSAYVLEDKPADVKAIESKAKSIYKNDKGFWEADYGDGIVMVFIPPGEFKMGQTDEEKKWLIDQVGEKSYNMFYKDEIPLHKVYLDGCWMGKIEVTVKQFNLFVKDKGYVTQAESSGGAYTWDGNKWVKKEGVDWKNPGFKQDGNHPVVCVSWNDAAEYCKWLSDKTGLHFKLPTEAQWEMAARGTDDRKYPWGNHEPYYREKWYANYAAHNSLDKRGEDGFQFTAPVDVDSYPQGATPYGILNMAGNVVEWCNDRYGSDYYEKSPDKNPIGLTNGTDRVLRGGGWNSYAAGIRCAIRNGGDPSIRSSVVGFRLCQDNK